MDVNLLRILTTLACFAVFIGIVVWACSGRNRASFEQAARIPFEQD